MSHQGGKAMPVVPYYHGRPACVWTAAMSGPAPATTRNPTAAAPSPASPRPVAPTAHRMTLEETSAPVVTAGDTSAWEAWASNWFTPHRQILRSSQPASGPVARTGSRLYQVRATRLRCNSRQRDHRSHLARGQPPRVPCGCAPAQCRQPAINPACQATDAVWQGHAPLR